MVLPLRAQELAVQSFILNATDLEARVNPVFDLNGEACALIKVAKVVDGISFEEDISRTDINGKWAEVSDFHLSGEAVTGGVMLNFGKFGIMMRTTIADFSVDDLEFTFGFRMDFEEI